MPQYLSPGVFVVETDFSHYVKSISTSSAGFIGVAEKGPINQVRYTNLPAGSYFFHVQAVNEDGSASPEVVSQVIRILPPLWGRWYVQLAGILMVTVVGYFLVSAWEGIEHGRKESKLSEESAEEE